MEKFIDELFREMAFDHSDSDNVSRAEVQEKCGERVKYVTVEGVSVMHIECHELTVRPYYFLYSHGRGSSLLNSGLILDLLCVSENMKCDVICYDYPGYTETEGVATEETVYQTVEKVYLQYCLKSQEGKKCVLWGQSIGSGPTCYLAEKFKKNQFLALILDSPILSAYRMIRDIDIGCTKIPKSAEMMKYIALHFRPDPFNNMERKFAKELPIIIFYGMQDQLIPHSDFYILQAAFLKNKSDNVVVHTIPEQEHDIDKNAITHLLLTHHEKLFF